MHLKTGHVTPVGDRGDQNTALRANALRLSNPRKSQASLSQPQSRHSRDHENIPFLRRFHGVMLIETSLPAQVIVPTPPPSTSPEVHKTSKIHPGHSLMVRFRLHVCSSSNNRVKGPAGHVPRTYAFTGKVDVIVDAGGVLLIGRVHIGTDLTCLEDDPRWCRCTHTVLS